MFFVRLVDPGVDGPGTGEAGYRHLSLGLFMEERARFGARGQTRMKNDPRCARASSRPLALSAVPGGATLGDAFTRRASAAEEDLDEDADDVAGDEDRAHVPASRGSAPALRAKKRRRVALRGEEKIEHLPLHGHVAGSALELREEPRAVQDRHRVRQQQPAARDGDDGTRCFFPADAGRT